MGTIWLIAYGLQWLFIAALMFLILRLMKLVGRYVAQVENINNSQENIIGPPLGVTAPELNSEIEIDVKSNSHLLLFFSTGCSYCKDVINELSSTELIYRNISVLIKIDDFSIFNEYKQILEEHHIICEPLVEQVFNDYSIKGFPFAIYIKNGKVISKGPAPSLKAINEVKRITGKVA